MKHLCLLIILVICAGFMLTGCNKKTEQPEPTVQISEEELKMVEIKLPEAVETTGSNDLNLEDFKANKDGIKAQAHTKYLNDSLTFLPVPSPMNQGKQTALVASNSCMLYPVQELKSNKDAENLKDGTPIPIGTVLNISGERINSTENPEWYNGLFEYDGNYNWFYKTEYEGQKGIVYGADLFLGDTDRNNILSLLYKSKGRFDKFYPICGYTQIAPEIQTTLHTNRIALQEVAKDEYSLYLDRPDDMISLYLNHENRTPFGWKYSSMGSNLTPMFITTDLFAHSQHLIFDQMLQHVEETVFIDKLEKVCDSYIEKLSEMHTQTADTAENIGQKNTDDITINSIVISNSETIEKALLYFQVARALLDLAPPVAEENSSYRDEENTEPAVDKTAVLAKYPESVQKEIALMDEAFGIKESKVFEFADGVQYKEDYSQYIPRGHYTKNERLKAYFRTMMWFGRINFSVADTETFKITPDTPLTESQILAMRMTPVSLLITDLTSKDENLFETWRDMFEPVTSLIGKSDDLSFFDVMPLWQEQKVQDTMTWITDKDNIIKFATLAHEKLEPPAIAGNSLFYANQSEGSSTTDKKPAMGWRLFGQRFTYDSWIHHNVSAPRLFSRDMVSGLDVMKALGSNTADLYLRDEYETHSELKPKLDSLEQYFASKDENFWTSTYYNMILFETAAQSRFEPGTGFYFTETPKWAVKSMLASHGTWAELRHDTILYVKQSYAERAGGDDIEPTYRAEKLPQTVHYIEPNVPFLQGYKLANALLRQTYERYGLLDEKAEKALSQLQTIADQSIKIATLELNDQPVPDNDLAWISTIPSQLAQLVLVYQNRYGYTSEDQLKMAVIADVFTNAELGQVLEVGVGIPYRIYVALNDGQGGKRIAVGYTFSYYEFPHPMSDRLTDEAWKEAVYGDQQLDSFKPFWSQNQTLKAFGFSN